MVLRSKGRDYNSSEIHFDKTIYRGEIIPFITERSLPQFVGVRFFETPNHNREPEKELCPRFRIN